MKWHEEWWIEDEALTCLPLEEKHREGKNSGSYAQDLRFGKHEISQADKF